MVMLAYLDTRSSKMNTIQDRLVIIDTVNAIFIGTDTHNWQLVYNAFSSEVFLDYSSMGAEAATLSSDTIISSWQGILPGFDVTQHSISNHVVTLKGDEANCFSYGTALHYLPDDDGDVWRVVGHYDHHLIRTEASWRVDKMIFTLKFIDGNSGLAALAQERVKRA